EHVVADGGSTDDTKQLLRAAERPGFSWLSEPDRGQSDAINKAFARSSGEIIGWLNSDDAYFSRDVVARVVDAFDRHPEVGVVYGHAARVDADGHVLYVLWVPPGVPRLLARGYNPVRQPAVFIRRSAIGRETLVDSDFDYMMDRELWLHLSRRTRFIRLDRILAVDRHHAERKSWARRDLRISDRKLLLERYGIPENAPSGLLRQGVALALRVGGLLKVTEAARGGDAIPTARSTIPSVAVRQIAHLQRLRPGEG
ncbi:MAG: glycosyltransferase, partial [Chloroflexota bacterium]|nr:glycosyltransferase [Chloroflexota bacterium]